MPYLNGQVISDEDLQGKLGAYRKENPGADMGDQAIFDVWEGRAEAPQAWQQPHVEGGGGVPAVRGAHKAAMRGISAGVQAPASPAGLTPEQTQAAQPPMATTVQNQAAANTAQNTGRDTSLWGDLWKRATQDATVDPNNPNVKAQTEAYGNEEERAKRNYLADAAESAGPYANLTGEARLASERVGQRTGNVRAQLVGQEIKAVRDEKAQAYQQLQGMLTADEDRALREELSVLDAQLREQGYGLQQQGLNLQSRGLDQNYDLASQGLGLQAQGLDQNWQQALMQNQQFQDDLGLRAEDRSAYWDAIRRGIL